MTDAEIVAVVREQRAKLLASQSEIYRALEGLMKICPHLDRKTSYESPAEYVVMTRITCQDCGKELSYA